MMQIGGQMHTRSSGNDPLGLNATALMLKHGEESFVRIDIDLDGFQCRSAGLRIPPRGFDSIAIVLRDSDCPPAR